LVIKPLEEDHTPGTVKPFQVSLVEPVACSLSQAEIFAAICKEYRCARLFGERTAGAFNGGTMSVKLPGDFALFAVPFMRSVSPGGADYEGRGVIPDVPVEPTGRAGDQPLAAALRLVAKDLQRTGPAY